MPVPADKNMKEYFGFGPWISLYRYLLLDGQTRHFGYKAYEVVCVCKYVSELLLFVVRSKHLLLLPDNQISFHL